MKYITKTYWILQVLLLLLAVNASAQGDASVHARIDATKITVGDQVRLFIEAAHHPAQSRLQWAVIPDTFNSLEVVEKGKIDTLTQGDVVTYKQRLLITGFDSGSFKIPAFQFPVISGNGNAYTLQTDSFRLLVNTVPVDTTQPFRPIKGIMAVNTSWKDYIIWIAGGIILIALIVVLVSFFLRRKQKHTPEPPQPAETFHEKALRMLRELEQKQLWQKGEVKEYYTELTDIVRSYLEDRFHTPAMELTSDQILDNAHRHPEMRKHYDELAALLTTADLAKFAKAQPLPHEHTAAMEDVQQFIMATRPVIIETPDNEKTS